MAQKGTDEEGILGFLPEDIQKELRRGKRLVCTFEIAYFVDILNIIQNVMFYYVY